MISLHKIQLLLLRMWGFNAGFLGKGGKGRGRGRGLWEGKKEEEREENQRGSGEHLKDPVLEGINLECRPRPCFTVSMSAACISHNVRQVLFIEESSTAIYGIRGPPVRA